MTPLLDLVGYADRLLDTAGYEDWPDAFNGLQVENRGRVVRIVAAVDAAEAALRHAGAVPGTLLLVHHGLFWGGARPVRGVFGRKLRRAFEADLAVYSSHLPLDAHPRIGNNTLLARGLGLREPQPWLALRGRPIGRVGLCRMDRAELARRLGALCGGRVHVCPGGPARTRRVGIVSGAGWPGAAALHQAGIDTFVTGEGPQHSYIEAEEAGINLIYGGHYATETLGVKALAERLARRFRLPWEFFDHPTGL